MRKQTSSDGFGIVELLLILVIVGILGFTGWFVLKAKHSTDNLYNNAAHASTNTKVTTKTPVATPSKQSDPYAGWAAYTSKLEKISLKYPSDWTVTNNGDLFSILNNTSQEEDFSVESSAEQLTTGTLVRANIILNTATSGLNAGGCHGLVVHFIKPITVSGRNLYIVSLDSFTHPGKLIGIYLTDEQGLHVGGATSSCTPSFASRTGNSNVIVSASFSRPPQPGDKSDGANIELTEDEYNQSTMVKQELQVLESLSY